MKFTRENLGVTTIRGVSEQGIVIANETLAGPLMLSAEGLVDAVVEKSFEQLLIDDFSPLLALQPEVVIVGTGTDTLFSPRELMFAFARHGTGFEVMETRAAARTFNVLAGEGRRVGALIYPL